MTAKSKESPGIVEAEFHLPFVDGMRGVGILLVMFFHLSAYVCPDDVCTSNLVGLEKLIFFGPNGIQVFFMISAFTLYRTFAKRLDRESHPYLNFYIRRSSRILPLWWLCTILFGLWGPESHESKSVAATAFFYMAFLRGGIYPEVISMGWSIYVEEFFYAFFPMWHKLSGTIGRSLRWIAIGLGVAVGWEWIAPKLGLPLENNFVRLFPLDNFFCFFIGILICQLDQAGHLKKLKEVPTVVLWLGDFLIVTGFYQFYTRGHFYMAVPLTAGFIICFSERSLLGKLTRNELIKTYGKCCFSIYLLSQFVLHLLNEPLLKLESLLSLPLSVDLRTIIFFIPFSLIMLAVALFSFRFFEVPCVNLGRLLIKRSEAGPRSTFNAA